jgi:Spx/MgsR family transcriptional regulator
MGSDVRLYGLANCDTTRAARKWLETQGVVATFHDLRADGLTRAMVGRWVDALGWEKVLNKASTTWRGLPEGGKASLDRAKAVELLLAHPTLVKRPVLEVGGVPSVGFKAADWSGRFTA